MVYGRFQRPMTGMDIGSSSVKIVQVQKDKKGWRLLAARTFPFPKDTLKLSLKTQNINDPQAFLETIGEALNGFEGRVHRVGLSIPNEIIKIAIKRYSTLPKSREEAERMIAWMAKKSLPFPAERTKISHFTLSDGVGPGRKLLVAIGSFDVIREYELNLRELKIEPEVIRPAGINQFNFYSDRVPRTGTMAFLGLFRGFFNLFVCVHGIILFYHGVKRGFSDIHFFQDVDMTLNLFRNENPGYKIEKLFFASQVGFGKTLEQGLRTMGEMSTVRMREEDVIFVDDTMADLKEGGLPSFAAAIGAAQSLA
jgi:hypothetical protein